MKPAHLYLASASPRRRELLAQLGVEVEVVLQDVPEDRLHNETPEHYVSRLALEKARAGLAGLGGKEPRLVLGADTAVVIDDVVMGKPIDKRDALVMLQTLSGRTHRVLSAVAVVRRDDLGQDIENVRVSESCVIFRVIEEWERIAYWETREPIDKAGAYAIQGLAALFIERLEGSYSGVMGLPLFETAELLRLSGIEILAEQQ